MNDLSLSRRAVLGGAAVAGLGLAFSGSLEAFARPDPRHPGGDVGYGPLVPDPAGLLSLPAGFTYVVVARSGSTPTDDVNPATGTPNNNYASARWFGTAQRDFANRMKWTVTPTFARP